MMTNVTATDGDDDADDYEEDDEKTDDDVDKYEREEVKEGATILREVATSSVDDVDEIEDDATN